MFTTGTKYLIGSTVLAGLAAVSVAGAALTSLVGAAGGATGIPVTNFHLRAARECKK